MVNRETWIIDYDRSYKNQFSVPQAVAYFLKDDEMYEAGGDSDGNFERGVVGFILSPQSINPFLRAVEAMGLSRQVVVLPAFDHSDDYNHPNAPAYLIIKIGEVRFVKSLEIG